MTGGIIYETMNFSFIVVAIYSAILLFRKAFLPCYPDNGNQWDISLQKVHMSLVLSVPLDPVLRLTGLGFTHTCIGLKALKILTKLDTHSCQFLFTVTVKAG